MTHERTNIPATSILVTGANGFVGSAVTERLVRDTRTVVAASRVAQVVPSGAISLALGNLKAFDWSSVLDGIDTVVHCAARAHVLREEATDTLAEFRAVNRDVTLALARAAVGVGVRRLVFISSIGVNGVGTCGTPFMANDVPHPHSPYAVAKWEAEQGLADIARDTGLEIVTIRPPLVIGLGPKGNLGSLVAALRRGLPLPLGAVTANRRDLVSLDTLVDLIVRSIDHPAAPGAPLLVSDGFPLSTRAVIERLAALHELRPKLVSVPAKLLGVSLQLVGRRALAAQLLGDLEVDIAETCRRLDWTPPLGVNT